MDDWLAAKLARLAVKPEPLVDEMDGLECQGNMLPTRVGRTVRGESGVASHSSRGAHNG